MPNPEADATPNYAELTDDEMMNIDDSAFVAAPDNELPASDGGEEEGTQEEGTTPEAATVEAKDEEVKPQDQPEAKDESQEETQNQEEESQDESVEEEEVTPEDLDFRAETLAPLKANGKELVINSIEELRNLASMGANYSKKMQTLKPHLKLLKTMDKHDLLTEESVNYLISLTKGDKNAISKLLSDSDLDPNYMELPEATDDYQADDYTIPDNELALDAVLEELSSSEHYATTMDILGNQWDQQSRETVAANPQAVKTIHDQVQSGVYAKISAEVERQRMLGNLTSQSDVEAYDAVGQAMQEQGHFNPTPDSGSDASRKAQRKAAGAARNLGQGKAKKPKQLSEFDIFNMTDKEIEALTVPGLT